MNCGAPRRTARPAASRPLRFAVALLLTAALAAAPPSRATAQARQPHPLPAFFGSDSVLALTLRTDLRAVRRDRDTTRAQWHEATLTVAGTSEGGGPVTVPLRVRTRGIYRLAHCGFPPLRLRFAPNDVRATVLRGLGRPKLVASCEDTGEYEQYLLLEYAIYRVYRLLTPLSLAARLVRVTYEDAEGRGRPVTRYGIVTEDPERFAARWGGELWLETGAGFRRLARSPIEQLSVFQYLIGNTDWAVPPRHNIALVKTDSLYAVPFDFDWTGAVDARYAVPSPRLHIRTVRDRQYRGICQTAERLEPVLARFEALKDSIAAVYRTIPDLNPRTVERTLRYYDEFYREAADRRRFAERIVAPDCGW